nr:reverse transcriptase domain-containing protein [Tanacetum cinerariifolium]
PKIVEAELLKPTTITTTKTTTTGGPQRHIKEFPLALIVELKAGNGNVVARAYGVSTAGGNPNANVVTGTLLLNNHCASILFDTGADKSFVSTAFSSLININPSTLEYSYDVELADGFVVVIVVGFSSSASTILGYMSSPLAVGAFGTTWSIM